MRKRDDTPPDSAGAWAGFLAFVLAAIAAALWRRSN